jgi:hypothetical protein
MTGILIKRGNLDTGRHAHREGNVKTQERCHLEMRVGITQL